MQHTSLFGLAPDGVCPATDIGRRGALLPHHFTLTALACGPRGGIFSVALSVDSRPPGVTWHPALWSPDFPLKICNASAAVSAIAQPARRIV